MSLVRRNSSKAGLQNLMKLTAQRSVEDAEEVERERRRRAREMRRRDSGSVRGESPESDTPTEDSQVDGCYKPSSSPSLEEDEGFSDWTQRRERQKQLRLQEQTQLHRHHQKNGARDEEEEEEQQQQQQQQQQQCEPNTGQGDSQPSLTASRLQKQEQERQEMERRKQRQEEAVRADRARREREREQEEQAVEDRRRREDVTRVKEERNRPIEAERKTEMKLSCTSRVVLNQEPKHTDSNGNASPQEKISHSNKTSSWARRSSNRSAEPEENEAILETEQRLEKIRRGLQEKESQELEQLRQRQTEAEHELEELKRRREERRRIREEEERRRGEEEQSRLAREEEDKRRMKEDIERRRMEAAERMKSLSTTCEGDQTFSPFSPKTPTYKITERTESLSRSLKKSNSFKKTAPLVLTSTIDDKLEQYTHAIENSIETRSVKAAPNDLPNTPEVATKKNLFEAGEVFSQSPTKAPGCKDTESLKVGVANLITQWVKGPNDPNRPGTGKSTDVKPGDVMQKRNMWEGMGESFRPGQRKGSTSGKKYKFVVSGHGKYEKKPVDGETEGELSDDL